MRSPPTPLRHDHNIEPILSISHGQRRSTAPFQLFFCILFFSPGLFYVGFLSLSWWERCAQEERHYEVTTLPDIPTYHSPNSLFVSQSFLSSSFLTNTLKGTSLRIHYQKFSSRIVVTAFLLTFFFSSSALLDTRAPSAFQKFFRLPLFSSLLVLLFPPTDRHSTQRFLDLCWRSTIRFPSWCK